MKYIVLALVFAIGTDISSAFSAERDQTLALVNVQHCYTNVTILDRYRRAPMSIDHLIYIIRKIENHPDLSNWDMQSVLAGIVNRFKVDGLYAKVTPGSSYYQPEPYMDTLETSKRKLINELGYDDKQLPNNILTNEEGCALHWMISHSVNYTRREEEDENYWRAKRDLPIKMPTDSRQKRQIEQQASTYPLERGTVYTKWGTVTAGTVLMGLYFGLMAQSVLLKNLVQEQNLEDLPGSLLSQPLINYWGATLAGDIGQTAVLNGYKSDSYAGNELVGPKGDWNSTICPREFMLRDNDTGLTMSEVYGGIDGILLALEIDGWDSSNRRLSHLLEMYYSEEGVLYDKVYRACDRMDLFKDYIDRKQLEEEAKVFAYAYMLYPGVVGAGEIPVSGFNKTEEYVKKATDALYSFINSVDYNDCDYMVEEIPSQEIDEEELNYNSISELNVETPHDLYIVLDLALSNDNEIQEIKNIIMYLANELQNGSRVALYYANGNNLEDIWTMNFYTSLACVACDVQILDIRRGSGMDFESIMEELSDVFDKEEEEDKEDNVRGSNSKVILFMTPGTEFEDKHDNRQRFYKFERDHAYVRFLALGDNTWTEILDDEDVISFSANEETIAQNVYDRLQELPGRLLDPKCDENYDENKNKDQFSIYLTPNTVKYYDLNSIYFHAAEQFWIKIEGDGGYVAVCVSRSKKLPNIDTDGEQCYTTDSGERELSLSFKDACEDLGGDDHPKECNNVYMSFEAIPDGSTSDKCDEMECTRPDQLKVDVFLEDTKCGACALLASPLMWILCIALLLLQKL